MGNKEEDLGDYTYSALGIFEYAGITTKNQAAIYNRTAPPRGEIDLETDFYLVKDWNIDSYWKVVVSAIEFNFYNNSYKTNYLMSEYQFGFFLFPFQLVQQVSSKI